MGGRTRGHAGMRGGPQVSGGRRRGALSEVVRTQLDESWALMDQGAQDQAAAGFTDLAGKLAERGETVVALHLQVTAAATLAKAGKGDEALEAGKDAVPYALQTQNRPVALRKLSGLVGDLKAAGHDEAADALADDVKGRMDAKKLPPVEAPATVNRAMRRSLPKTCPACGVRLKADLAVFSEGGGASCARCGTSLAG